jgi:hypothetical protein
VVVELRHLRFATEDSYFERLRSLEKAKTVVHPCILRIWGIHASKVE